MTFLNRLSSLEILPTCRRSSWFNCNVVILLQFRYTKIISLSHKSKFLADYFSWIEGISFTRKQAVKTMWHKKALQTARRCRANDLSHALLFSIVNSNLLNTKLCTTTGSTRKDIDIYSCSTIKCHRSGCITNIIRTLKAIAF